MRLALELSGEHPELPRAEATAVLETLGGHVEEKASAGPRILEAGLDIDVQLAADRLALTRRLVEPLAQAPVDVDAIAATAGSIELGEGTFAVRCSRLDPDLDPQLGPRIERALGTALGEGATVELEDPDTTVRVLLDDRAVVGIERAVVDRSAFEDRHVEARPYFSPISLHPRLARALVNLAHVEPGDTLLDPFCGTGGVALEAAMVGAEVLASDIDPEMVEGTRATLEHFDRRADVREGDVETVLDEAGTVDAIVTDPPYGRSSTTKRESIGALYDRFLAAAADALGPGRRLVTVLPDPSDADRAPASLSVEAIYAWYVHRSLTRHVTVFCKDGASP